MKLPALLLVFVAALAAVAWFSFGGPDELAPAGAPAAAGPDRGAPQTGTLARADAPAAGAKASAQAAAVEASRTLDRDEVPDAVEQRDMLRGRLVDGSGEPRPGIDVQVSSWTLGVVIDVAMDTPGANTRRDEVKTDADGRFAVPMAAGRSGNLTLAASDLVFEGAAKFEAEGGDTDLGDLVVVAESTLSGVVQDRNGQPVAGVIVEAQLGAIGLDTTSSTRTGDDGAFTVGKLRPGKWTLRTSSSRFLSTAEQYVLDREEQRGDLVIVVEPGLSIAGRVVDDRGRGVAGMKVFHRHSEQIGGMQIERFSDKVAAITDEIGRFELAGLAGSKATLRVSGKGHSTITVPNVETGTRDLEVKVERLASIAGVLTTADGTPLVGSRVRAVPQRQRSGAVKFVEEFASIEIPGREPSAETDAAGRFVIEGVPPGTVRLVAKGNSHVAAELPGVRVQPAQQLTGVRMLAEAGAVARIEVVDEGGEAIAGADVTVSRAPKPKTPGMSFEVRAEGNGPGALMDLGKRVFGKGKTDENGVVTIAGLPQGDAVVAVEHADFAPSERLPLPLPATGAVDKRVTLGLPGFVDVTVTRADGSVAAGTEVVLQVEGAGANQHVDKGKADGDGKLRFGPLGAGAYTVTLSRGNRAHSAGGMMVVVGGESDLIRSSTEQVTVRAGSTANVELSFPMLTRLHGRVIGSDGPVSGVVVEVDDGAEERLPGFGGRQQKTDADGAFSFEDLEPGHYIVRYGKAEQIVKARLELDIPPNTPELQRDLSLRTGTVRIVVMSADDGEPVERAEVKLVRGGGDGKPPRRQERVVMVAMTIDGDEGQETNTMTLGEERALTDEDGVAILEDVPIGEYTLKVESERFAPTSRPNVVVVERQLTDCGTLEVAAAGHIRGRVLGADGELAMAMVQRRPVGTQDWEAEMALRGSYRIRGLTPGKYEMRARAVGPTPGESTEVVVVEVTAGKTAVQDFTLGK